MFNEETIRRIVDNAEHAGAPTSLAVALEAELSEVLHWYRQRMERINRHTQVLGVLEECGYSVTAAADELGMSREGVYKHIRKSRLSTENPIGVDAEAA